jgi:hypothetical protein
MGEQLKRLADVLEARQTNAPLVGQEDPAEDDSISSLQRTLENVRRSKTADRQRMVRIYKKACIYILPVQQEAYMVNSQGCEPEYSGGDSL